MPDDEYEYIASSLPSAEILQHVVDVHCHPTDTEVRLSDVNQLGMTICAMASRRSDQDRVAQLARTHPDKVIPAFGYHPWFSHLISLDTVPNTPEAKEAHYRSLLLPDISKDANKETHATAFQRVLQGLPHPFPLPDLIAIIRGHLDEFLAAHRADPITSKKPMLGEVGLDCSFRVPFSAYRESEPPVSEDDNQPKLTPFFVPITHQQAILEAQFDLAIALGVNVSLHSVKAPAPTLAVLKRMYEKRGPQFDAISIDMHSCGVSASTWKDIQNRYPNVYISFSTAINFRSPDRLRELIQASAADRLLVESDVDYIDQCAPRTWAMLLHIAKTKGWTIEKDWSDDLNGSTGAVHQLELNWNSFEAANYMRKEKRKRGKKADHVHAIETE